MYRLRLSVNSPVLAWRAELVVRSQPDNVAKDFGFRDTELRSVLCAVRNSTGKGRKGISGRTRVSRNDAGCRVAV